MDNAGLVINDQNYSKMPGLIVPAYYSPFPERPQSGFEIIRHGERVAANGESRINPAPGQRQPVQEIGAGFRRQHFPRRLGRGNAGGGMPAGGGSSGGADLTPEQIATLEARREHPEAEGEGRPPRCSTR
jgi:hypothetical protein